MTAERDLDRQLATWFGEQETAPPADLWSRSMARIDTAAQRPAFLSHVRHASWAPSFAGAPSLAPWLVLFVLLLSAAVVVTAGGQLVKPRVTLVSTPENVWQPSDAVAFRARLDPSLEVPFKWRAGAYAVYTGDGWEWGEVARQPIPAHQAFDVLSPAGDAPTTDARLRIQYSITPDAFVDGTILGPNMIELVDRPTDAISVGADRWYASIESREDPGPYTVSALVPNIGGIDGLDEGLLRTAGTAYSPAMLETYTALPDAAMGPFADALLARIRSEVSVPDGADPNNAYDLVRTMQDHLRDEDNFSYTEDVRELRRTQCQDVSTVECFARIRQGYCEFYASTMAVLLRSAGIPARIAYGFLPGERGANGVEVVGAWLAHWWVEVYFPDVGWIEFDPTGGGVGRPLPLEPAVDAPSAPAEG